MGSLAAIHVRASRSPSLAARLARYGTAFTEPGAEFCTVELAQPGDPLDADLVDLAALSSEWGTDVLWLAFGSAADAYRFHHWRSGRPVRALVFGCVEQGLWEQAEGDPEPWERGAWAGADIRAGRTVPGIDARESARAAAEFYGLPSWS